MLPQFFAQKNRRKKAIYLQQWDISHALKRSLLVFTSFIAAHILVMTQMEDLSFGDAIWYSLTTVTTVGFGDIAAQTIEGRAATIVFLYFGGIFVLANLGAEYFDSRSVRRDRQIKGLWEWKLMQHIVIINTPNKNGTEYFKRLISQIRAHENFKQVPIQILTQKYPDGLPPELRALGVIHYHGGPGSEESYSGVNIKEAGAVMVLARDEYDGKSDAETFDTLYRLDEHGLRDIPVIAECLNDRNRDRFYKVGAQIVVRPIRAYPELLIRALVAPGSEKILENLFTHDGDHLRRYDVRMENISWLSIVTSLVKAGFGTPLAFIRNDGTLVTNAAPEENVSAKALLLLVRADLPPSQQQITDTINL